MENGTNQNDGSVNELERILQTVMGVPYTGSEGNDKVRITDQKIEGDYGLAILGRDAYSKRSGYPAHLEYAVLAHIPTGNVDIVECDDLIWNRHRVMSILFLKGEGEKVTYQLGKTDSWGHGKLEPQPIKETYLFELENRTKLYEKKGVAFFKKYEDLCFTP